MLIIMVFGIVGCAGAQTDTDTETTETAYITLKLNGGKLVSAANEFEWEVGTTIDELPTPTKDGAEFLYWSVGGEEASFPYLIEDDIIFVANWKTEATGTDTETDTEADTSTNTETDTETDTETETETETGTDTETETGTETETDTNTEYVPPILDHDTIKYTPRYTTDKKKLYYGNYSVKVPIITKYYNNYSAALSMTFDDGADVEAANLASEIMSEYGFKGTLMVNIGNIQGNLSRWQELVALGTLDIGSHGWSHLDPSTITTEQMEHEIKDSYDFLQDNFGEYNPVTYATPLSHLTDEYEEYLKYCGFISNRLETFGTMISPDNEIIDMYYLYSK